MRIANNSCKLHAPAPMTATCTLESPVGTLWLGASENGLMALKAAPFNDVPVHHSEQAVTRAKGHLQAACTQLAEFFEGKRHQFDLALAPKGTEFQRAVWQALLALPWGETASYSDIALQIARPKAVRAVGAANGANPVAIIIPCHRVIGKGGALTGYAWGLKMKASLLKLESAIPSLR